MNVFLPSLPDMAAYFQTDYRVMQLSVGLYLACSAVLQLLIGPLSDKFGRRPVLLWGLGLFVLASLGCVFAQNIHIFLFFRMAQSVVATTMVLSRAVVRDLYEDKKAASMIGYVTMGMALVPMVGPAIGGFLQVYFGWTSSFWLLVFAGIALFFITWQDLGETKARSGKSLLAQFKEYPELLTSPRFWSYTFASALSSGSFFAYLGGAPFIGTELLGMNAQSLGLVISAPALGYMAGNFISGLLAVRVGINPMVAVGCLISILGPGSSLAAELSATSTPLSFFAPMVLVGLGNGLVIPNATAGALSVRPHLAGTASGLSGALMIGIGAVLSVYAGTLITAQTGAAPLLILMMSCGILGFVAIMIVVRRERQLRR